MEVEQVPLLVGGTEGGGMNSIERYTRSFRALKDEQLLQWNKPAEPPEKADEDEALDFGEWEDSPEV